MRIKILKNGPYLVTGNIPLKEKIILPKGKNYEFLEGQAFSTNPSYSLCRCGKSKNMPFCDGSHVGCEFDGTETASKDSFIDRANLFEGPGVDLLDDGRCAFARFCHRNKGNVWELTRNSNDPNIIREAIIASSECPSGRLVSVDKQGNQIEPFLEPSIDVLQDPERNVSCGLFVKGNIPIESSDGTLYEIRNRVMLCRCGKSRNKPFCDATHVSVNFKDKK